MKKTGILTGVGSSGGIGAFVMLLSEHVNGIMAQGGTIGDITYIAVLDMALKAAIVGMGLVGALQAQPVGDGKIITRPAPEDETVVATQPRQDITADTKRLIDEDREAQLKAAREALK